eukprot:gene25806-11481_t
MQAIANNVRQWGAYRIPSKPLLAHRAPCSVGRSLCSNRSTSNYRFVCLAEKPAGDSGAISSDEELEAFHESFETEAGMLVGSITEDIAEVDFLGESTSGNLTLDRRNVITDLSEGIVGALGMSSLNDIINIPSDVLKDTTKTYLDALRVPENLPEGNPQRAIYCSRTLNLGAVKAIGVPVDGMKFDPNLVTRGLIMDKEHGNLIKVDRFG